MNTNTHTHGKPVPESLYLVGMLGLILQLAGDGGMSDVLKSSDHKTTVGNKVTSI